MKIEKINIDGYIGASPILGVSEYFSLSKLKTILNNLDSDVTDLHVYINSGGGSISEGWAIYDKLKACGLKVTTIGEGIVGSIATIIYLSGSVRQLNPNTNFFIHNPYWLPGESQPMEGNDLIALGEELIKEEEKIVKFYASITGESEEFIAQLMLKATDLTSYEAIKIGFAHNIVNGFVEANKYRLVALLDKTIKTNINQKQNKMSNQKKSVLNAFAKFQALLNNVLGEVVNMELTVTDAEGNPVNLFIESETEDIIGKKAYIVDTDGNQTEANGEFTDESGKVIKIEAGVVIEINEPVSKTDLELANETIETLKAELSAKNEELQAKQTEFEELKNNLVTVNNEFKALKNVIIGSKASFETGEQVFNNQKLEPKETNAFLDGLAKSVSKKK